ncbi:sigma-70 family RNA polymerase sigma factor [Streptomyces sp. NPDC058755]|uniref:sigma-70 family RNA polymerase sigma factor n=1 Tax=Streptomyces sp. NPDC058755 TaxID=3346624 RepID=UPI0036BBFB32
MRWKCGRLLRHRRRGERTDDFPARTVSLPGGRVEEARDAVVIESTLDRARAGDGETFRRLTEPYRRELQLHCYRILGSVQDAEDMVQETLLAAWRGLGGFQERASVRAWPYRIATNRCLNALRDTSRRPQPREPARRPRDVPEPTRRCEQAWFDPYPDALLEDLPDTTPGPEARYETREALALSFVAGLQRLPPRQRAVLVLRDVLGFPYGRGRGPPRQLWSLGRQRPAASAYGPGRPEARTRPRPGAAAPLAAGTPDRRAVRGRAGELRHRPSRRTADRGRLADDAARAP